MVERSPLEMSFIYDRHVSNRFPRVGVIGAGPLARAMISPAADLGIDLHIFAVKGEDAAAQIARNTVGDYRDLAQLIEFAGRCDLLTFVDLVAPASLVKSLEADGVKVYPTSAALALSQNMVRERSLDFDSEISILVARSPHGQSTSWAPTEVIRGKDNSLTTFTPAQKISSTIAEISQRRALELAQSIAVVGVMTVVFLVKGEEISLSEIFLGPHEYANWSIEGAVTSQYEQHLRAILDLPLGSPEMNHDYVVTSNLLAGAKSDMYRPYLHLMARNPRLRFHQYRNVAEKGEKFGHVTAYGKDPLFLMQEVEHASDYFSGAIDE